MRSILLLVTLLLSLNTYGQKAFQFVPSIGYTGAAYSGRFVAREGGTGPTLKLRFIGDTRRWQVGGGLELHANGTSIGDPLDGVADVFINPHFTFGYKVKKWDKSYLYAAMAAGMSISDGWSTGSVAKGLIGADVGWVILSNRILNLELHESYRFLNGDNGSAFITPRPMLSNDKLYVHLLTTSIGIRLNKVH